MKILELIGYSQGFEKVQNQCSATLRAKRGHTLSTRATRARAIFSKISELHVSTRATHARAEKPVCAWPNIVQTEIVTAITSLLS